MLWLCSPTLLRLQGHSSASAKSLLLSLRWCTNHLCKQTTKNAAIQKTFLVQQIKDSLLMHQIIVLLLHYICAGCVCEMKWWCSIMISHSAADKLLHISSTFTSSFSSMQHLYSNRSFSCCLLSAMNFILLEFTCATSTCKALLGYSHTADSTSATFGP